MTCLFVSNSIQLNVSDFFLSLFGSSLVFINKLRWNTAICCEMSRKKFWQEFQELINLQPY